jgi:sigma-B regulation protein RsbU (phosphoserine phosphatase)
VSFAAHYKTSWHAGGDYYDVVELGADRFGVLVADVSGHGAPAAIVMAMIRTAFHMHPEVQHDPPAVLHKINRHFRYLWESEMFATAVYAVIDAARGTVRISCAGHPPPLVIRPGHHVLPLSVQSVLPLLWMELGDVPCAEHALQPGVWSRI